MTEPTALEKAIQLAVISFADWPAAVRERELMTQLERGVQRFGGQYDLRGANATMALAAIRLRAIFDPENQPSQFGTQLLSE